MQITTETITPTIALSYLQTIKKNRKVKYYKVEQYARDMTKGNWKLSHQGISFNSSGELNDGQHRMLAIARAGIPVSMVVSRGIDCPEVFDTHTPRSIVDAACYTPEWKDMGKDQAAITRILALGIGSTNKNLLSYAELHKEYTKYKEGIDFSISKLKRAKGISASVRAAVARAFYTQDTDRLTDFCNVVNTGIPGSNRDLAALRFRERLSDLRGPKEFYFCATNAIKHFLDGSVLCKLYIIEKEQFELPVI